MDVSLALNKRGYLPGDVVKILVKVGTPVEKPPSLGP
jgi:hypothetical protein